MVFIGILKLMKKKLGNERSEGNYQVGNFSKDVSSLAQHQKNATDVLE